MLLAPRAAWGKGPARASAPAPGAVPTTEPPVLGVEIGLYDPSHKAMEALHAALHRAEKREGQARLLFWGASHVASDLFTGYLRRELQKRFGDAGHGFVLPGKPWPFYRHADINIESSKGWKSRRVRPNDHEVDFYGLHGTFIESGSRKQFGAITTTKTNPVGRKASVFDLYYLRGPGRGRLDVRIDGKLVRRIKTYARKVGPGYATFRVPDGAHRFEVRPAGHGPVRIFGVAAEREVPGVILDTLGIRGARVRYQLLWDDALYREHLQRRHPDLVVLAYGTNESGDRDTPIATYESQLRRVLDRVRELLPKASCLLIGPSDWPDRDEEGGFIPRPRTAAVIEAQKRVGAEHGCAFFDLVAFQGGPMSMPLWMAADPPMAAKDGIHFTRLGYARLGAVLLKALMQGYEPDLKR